MGILLSWALLVLPWFCLLPLQAKRVKQFLSVAFLTTLIDTVFFQVAEVWDWWTVTTNVPFLTNVSSFTYGMLPVVTIGVFYFTYPNVWLFFAANLLMDAAQAFLISPYVFEKAGLYSFHTMNRFEFLLMLFSHVPVIYLYQRWFDAHTSYSHPADGALISVRLPDWLHSVRKAR